MEDYGRMHLSLSNLDQSPSLDVVDFPEVVAGGWERRRRPAAEIGQNTKIAEARVGPCVAVPYLIKTKLRGGLPVDERKGFDGLIGVSTVENG